MRKHEVLRMQHDALGLAREAGIGFPAVNHIAEQDVAECLHMHSDLVCASGMERAAHQRGDFAELFNDLPVGTGVLALSLFVHHRHLMPMLSIAANGLPDGTAEEL